MLLSMRIGAAVLIISLASLTASAQSDEDVAVLHASCVQAVDSGDYPNRNLEMLCNEYFELPSAYLVKCLRWVKKGFPSEIDKKACRHFCQSSQNWGPWYDYALPYEVRTLFDVMKTLNKQQRCFE